MTLLERLRTATAGSDELDADICRAFDITWSSDEDGNFGGYRIMPRRVRFTRDVGVALTLLSGMYCVYMMENPGVKYLPANASGDYTAAREIYVPVTSTLPLAICAAAVKART